MSRADDPARPSETAGAVRSESRSIRPLLTTVAVTLMTVGLLFTGPAARQGVLTRVGAVLTADDSLAPAELVALASDRRTEDVKGALVLEAADLYEQGLIERVLLLEPSPSPPEQELIRRGVQMPDLTRDRLLSLGIPTTSLTAIDAGTGDSFSNARALADFARRNDLRSVMVVVSPAVGRRFKRYFDRLWPEELPAPRIRTSRHAPFRADTWYQSRATLRTGLVELQHLVADYATHPW